MRRFLNSIQIYTIQCFMDRLSRWVQVMIPSCWYETWQSRRRFYRKTRIFTSLFLRAIINIFIQVLFPNIITYLDKTFKDEQNYINFQSEIIILNWCNFFNFIYQVSDAQTTHKNAKRHQNCKNRFFYKSSFWKIKNTNRLHFFTRIENIYFILMKSKKRRSYY